MPINELLNFFIHLDKSLELILTGYGLGIYLLLFLVVFCETGLVIAPFLPGDTLLFVSGTLASKGLLNLYLLFGLLSFAAIIGDTLNYWIGYNLGPKIFNKKVKFLNQENLIKAEKFYEKHGAKTIIYARFLPIIRTFAPFVAGIGKMKYKKFLFYNVVGAVLWIIIFLGAGYYFGNIQWVKDNLSLVILGIIILSFIPATYEYIIHKRKNKIVN